MNTDFLSSLNPNGSGLNISEIVTGLVNAETVPKIELLERKIATTETSISALGLLRAQFENLNTALGLFAQTNSILATSSDSAISIAVDDAASVISSVTNIQVNAIAERQVLEFGGFTAADAAVGAGDLVLEFGSWSTDAIPVFTADAGEPSQTLIIPSGTTLSELTDILASVEGVNTVLLDKGDGTFSLGITTEVGANNAIRITATEDIAEPGLAAFDMTGDISTLQIAAASDADILVNGITVSRATNDIDDLIPGTTLTLNATTSDPVKLAISHDANTALFATENLVLQLNGMAAILNAETANGVNGAAPGALAGDRTIEALKRQLSQITSTPLTGHGPGEIYLSQLGVRTERDGTLSFDSDAFLAGYETDPATFNAVFSDSFSSDNSLVSVTGQGQKSTESGSYAFVIDTMTGVATIGGQTMSAIVLEDGRTQYSSFHGVTAGITVIPDIGETQASITYGESLVSILSDQMDAILSSSGSLTQRENQLGDTLIENFEGLDALQTKALALETRYRIKFTAMELAISQLKSTGDYLTNLVDAWNNAN